MPSSIRERREAIQQRLKEHDAARLLIEAELLALRHVCPHADVETYKNYDYGGGCDLHWHCKDCGLKKVS